MRLVLMRKITHDDDITMMMAMVKMMMVVIVIVDSIPLVLKMMML